MAIAAGAVIRFAERHAEKAEELAASETDARAPGRTQQDRRSLPPRPGPRSAGLLGSGAGLLVHPPRRGDGAEHLGFAFVPGASTSIWTLSTSAVWKATLTREQAKELLECFWVKFNNQPAPPKVGVTAAESGTYTDFANINTGGLKPDGSDGVNEFTYLVLDVIDEMHLLQPSSNLQLSRKNPTVF